LNVEPAAITDFLIFSRLPFTYPEDIQENPQRFVCTGQRDIARIVTLQSSGTTGGRNGFFLQKKIRN
jgi:phenylacetate-coenzyme A ligase PaaK-like adenylate-forming protein